MNPKEYVTEETEQSLFGEEMCYAELHLGRVIVLYHGEEWPSDEPEYKVVTALYDEGVEWIYRHTEALTKGQAECILENYGPWDYAE